MRLSVTQPAQSVQGPAALLFQKMLKWWNDHNDGIRPWDVVNTFVLNAQNLTTAIVSKTAAYTAALTDVVILVDSTAGTVTITLPTAATITGQHYYVKDWKGKSATNNITIATTGGQTIDGGASKVLNTNYVSYTVVSDGANWAII